MCVSVMPPSRRRQPCTRTPRRTRRKPHKDANRREQSRSGSDIESSSDDDARSTSLPKTTRLASPIKSPLDKNEYRAIQLSNGLRALLISCKHLEESPDADWVSSYPSKDCSGTHKDDSPALLAAPHAYPSCLGRRNFVQRVPWHESGTSRKMKKSGDFKPQYSSVALTVGVGSDDDPPDSQGLAHLLEHMVFLGSDKFPYDQEFDRAVTNMNGFNNAKTGRHRTCYFYQVRHHDSCLAYSLDIFASMFRAPRLDCQAIGRELLVVDNEFSISQTEIPFRYHFLLNQVEIPDEHHPARSNGLGNKRTLLPEPANNDALLRLRRILKEFHSRHYFGANMRLVLQTPMALDAMERVVASLFEAISPGPSGKLAGSSCPLSSELSSYSFNNLKWLIVKPHEEIDKLILSWNLPYDLMTNYGTKPVDFIAALLTDQSPKSLRNYLEQKNLISGFYTRSDKNKHVSRFAICVELSRKGRNEIRQIIEAVFSYLAFLRDVGNDSGLYLGLQQLEQFNFNHLPPSTSIFRVLDLVEAMSLCPSQDTLYGSGRLFKYDETLVEKCLDELNPNKVSFHLLTNEPDPRTSFLTEKVFGTQYCLKDIEPEFIDALKNVEIYDEFELPCPQNWIPKNKLLPSNSSNGNGEDPEEDSDTDESLPLIKEPHFKVFLEPQPGMSTPQLGCDMEMTITASLKQHIASGMTKLASHMITEESKRHLHQWYRLGMDLSFKFKPDQEFCVEARCLNYRQSELVTTALDNLRSFAKDLKAEEFGSMKSSLLRDWNNFSLQPAALARDLALRLNDSDHVTQLEQSHLIRQTTFEDLQQFCKMVFSSIGQVEMTLFGHTTEDEAKAIALVARKHPLFDRMSKGAKESDNDELDDEDIKLPLGERCLRVQSLNSEGKVSAVYNVYTLCSRCEDDKKIAKLLTSSVSLPLFHELRTNQQLGYIVDASMHDDWSDDLVFGVVVVFQPERFCPCLVNNRIDRCLRAYHEKLLETDELSEELLRACRINKVPCQLPYETHKRQMCERFRFKYLPEVAKFRISAVITSRGMPSVGAADRQHGVTRVWRRRRRR